MKKILFFYLLAHLGAQNNYELENLVIFEDKYLIKFTENMVEGDLLPGNLASDVHPLAMHRTR